MKKEEEEGEGWIPGRSSTSEETRLLSSRRQRKIVRTKGKKGETTISGLNRTKPAACHFAAWAVYIHIQLRRACACYLRSLYILCYLVGRESVFSASLLFKKVFSAPMDLAYLAGNPFSIINFSFHMHNHLFLHLQSVPR